MSDEQEKPEQAVEAAPVPPVLSIQERREQNERAAASKKVQDWLDKYAEEKLRVAYASSESIVSQSQTVYLKRLVDEERITEHEAFVALCEIQAQMLKEMFQPTMTLRDEAQLRAIKETGRVVAPRGPKLIVPGGSQRSKR